MFSKKAKKPSIVWKYFFKVKTDSCNSNEVQCKLCSMRVKSSGNTTNLTNHLNRKHKVVISADPDASPKGSKEQECSTSETVTQLHSITPMNEEVNKSITENCSSSSSSNPADEDEYCVLSPLSLSSVSTRSTGTGLCESPNSTPKSSKSTNLKLKQPQINNVLSNIRSFEDGGQKAGNITNAILFMIAKDNLPLNTTEHEGFKYLMKNLVPLYKIPGRKTITELIEKKYELLAGFEKGKLSEAHYITLTCDVWTDTMNTVSYLGITSHFLNQMKLHSVTIGMIELSDKHTAEYLGTWLTKICKEWNICKEDIVAIVTDGGANIVKAVSDFVGKAKHLHCFAHLLNLVATQALATNNIELICTKVKNIITFFKHSVTAYDDLRKSTSLKLVQSVVTRWNSTYLMLERFVTLYEHVVTVLLKHPKSPSILSAAEIDIIKDVVIIMQPFFTITKELSGENYVTASKVIPLVNCLKNKIEMTETHSETSTGLKENILRQIVKRFGTTENVKMLSVATLLDPRFKKIHFTSAVSCSEAINKVVCFMREAEQQATTSVGQEEIRNPDVEMVTNTTNNDFVDYHKELVNKIKNCENSVDGSIMPTELKFFLDQPLADISTDPLQYWEANGKAFPKLFNVAQRYLAVTATSTPSERLFSRAGNILTETRNKLSPEHLNQLLFLNSLHVEDWHM